MTNIMSSADVLLSSDSLMMLALGGAVAAVLALVLYAIYVIACRYCWIPRWITSHV